MDVDIRAIALKLIDELDRDSVFKKGMAEGVRTLYAEIRKQAELQDRQPERVPETKE